MGDTEPEPGRFHVASWERRFWAWLIDVVVVGAVASALWGALGVVTFWSGPLDAGGLGGLGSANGLAFWAYWRVSRVTAASPSGSS